MTWFEWIGWVGFIFVSTVVLCVAVMFGWLLAHALVESFAVWRTERALRRRGAPPGV